MIRLSTRYVQRNDIARNLVPIARKNATIYFDKNRTTSAKRNHFPFIPATAMTFHKSQGGTFDQIVYSYDKKHDQQLFYVALSRVTSIEGLFNVSSDNNCTFYRGRRTPGSLLPLKNEFTRLAGNTLRTNQDSILEFLRAKQSALFLIFNCQSLRAHNNDLTDAVTQECLTVTSRPIGDLCPVKCILLNGQKVFSVVVYISPNQHINDIVKFLHFVLLPYTPGGVAELGEDYDKMSMILEGDFNIKFSSDEAQPLISFLENRLNLKMNTARNIPSTNYKTTLDGVFSRFLNDIKSEIYISYFSYHKPIITFLYNEVIDRIRKKIGEGPIYVSIDETTDVEGRYVANVVVGLMHEDKCSKSYLLTCEELSNLYDIKSNFGFITQSILKLENATLLLDENLEIVENTKSKLGQNKGPIAEKIDKKYKNVLEKNIGLKAMSTIGNILNGNNVDEDFPNLTPGEVTKFRYAKITSCDVERSFSKYKNILRSNRRSFIFENLKHHVVVSCNSFE
ncbi:hypothetical protein QTP88_027890 [Uroleucon formosanum]